MTIYRIYPIDTIAGIRYAQENNIEGLFYPNQSDGEFLELSLSEEDMLVMALTVACNKIEKCDDKVLRADYETKHGAVS